MSRRLKYLPAYSVIRALTDRVEKEHAQHLRDAQRIEDRSALSTNVSVATFGADGASDFAKLVGAGGAQSSPINGISTSASEDDIWGSILGGEVSSHYCEQLQTIFTLIVVAGSDSVNDTIISPNLQCRFLHNPVAPKFAPSEQLIPC